MYLKALASFVLLAGIVSCKGKFGDNIAWQSLDNGLAASKVSQKPVMVLIYRDQCPACHELAPKFIASQEIAQLATNFEMVEADDENQPSNPKFFPDGGYVPRILFFTPDGHLKTNVDNPNGHPDYKYYHYETESIIAAMKAALRS